MHSSGREWLVVGLLAATAAYALSETITLETYYPSPRGVYKELRVGGGGPFLDPKGWLHVIHPEATDTRPPFRVDADSGGTTPFVVAADPTCLGCVGIGTANPSNKLHIVDTAPGGIARPSLNIDSYSTTIGSRPQLNLRKSKSDTLGALTTTVDGEILGVIDAWGVTTGNAFNDDPVQIVFIQDGASGASRVPGRVEFKTSDGTSGAATRLTIKGNGNVGIGTTNPQNTLDVNGGIIANSNIALGSSGSIIGGTGNNLLIRGRGATGAEAAGVQFGDNHQATSRQFAIINGHDGVGITGGKLNIIGSTAVNTVPISASRNIIMSMDAGGNVGIGTTNPDNLLTLFKPTDSSTTRDFLYFRNGTYSTASMGFRGYIFYLSKTANAVDGFTFNVDSGNVGIGTMGAVRRLQVANGNIYVSDAGEGIIVKSPDGTICKRIGIGNDGNIKLDATTCP